MAIKRDGDFVTFTQFIQEEQQHYPGSSGQFSWLMSGVALATRMIGSYIRRAGLIDVWGEHGTTNVQGEVVKKLDIMANDALKRTLAYRGNVGVIASEEDDEPRVLQEVDSDDSYIVMFDPLDGSSNIDVNVSVGTIFTIFKNPPNVKGVERSVLQAGSKQVAAGYVLYGSSTVLVYTAGRGTHMFTLDPQFGTYLLTREHIKMPPHAPQYSVNEAYSHTFPEGYRRYLDWVKLQRFAAVFLTLRRFAGGGLPPDPDQRRGVHVPADHQGPAGQAAADVRVQPPGVHRRAGRRHGHGGPSADHGHHPRATCTTASRW